MWVATVVWGMLLLGLWVQGAGAATVYVNTTEAKLRQTKSVSARTATSVQRGQALKVIRQDNRWYYVATRQGKKGWIYRFKVTSKKPEPGRNVFAMLGGSSSKVAMKESSSARGIRSLAPTAERQARRRGRKTGAIQAVKDMEKVRVKPEELQSFWRAGKIGEYYEGR